MSEKLPKLEQKILNLTVEGYEANGACKWVDSVCKASCLEVGKHIVIHYEEKLSTLEREKRELEAQCGVMRKVLELAKYGSHVIGGEHCGHSELACDLCELINKALKPDAGRELLQRVERMENALKSILCQPTTEQGLNAVFVIAQQALEQLGTGVEG